MTSDEIKAAIERIRKPVWGNVITDLMNDYHWTYQKARERLIELLEQADPDTHVELPIDADCKPIHIGDRVYEQRGNVVEHPVEVSYMHLDSAGWVVYDTEGGMHEPCHCFHYRKPTLEETLENFAIAYGSVSEEYREKLVSDCAKLLRLREEDE